jgi:nucleotide sugar dehydrogenase
MTNEQGTLAVVGLGYVGLPLAVLAREKGWRVVGFDVNPEKVSAIARGTVPFQDARLQSSLVIHPIEATTDEAALQHADVIVVAVPTPIDAETHPDLGPLSAAVVTVAAHGKRGVLLSIESTVNPGVCEELVAPLLRERGRDVISGDVLLVHCPERMNPGDRRWSVRNIPRVLGGYTAEAVERGVAFYKTVLEAPVHRMSTLRATEAVKITENVFRDINIAFVNELAQSFDRLGIDVQEVIAGAATKPFAFMAHTPGCGVGGHCIPVDPYYLIEHARRQGFDHWFLRLARQINKGMPRYTVDRLIEAITEGGNAASSERLSGVRVALLGLSYKRDVDDLRESPALEIENILREEGAEVIAFDPYVPHRSTVPSLPEALRVAGAVVIATDHSAFRALGPKDFQGTPVRVVIDGRNCLPMEQFRGSGIVYRGIGRSLVGAEQPQPVVARGT